MAERTFIEEVLAHAIRIEASDVHISEGEYIAFRVHGDLKKVEDGGIVTPEIAERLAKELFPDVDKLAAFKEHHDADFAYVAQDGTPFRVNGFYKLGKTSFVLRRIEREAKKLEDLGVPE